MKTSFQRTIRVVVSKLRLDETGATAVEYGLMVALIAAVIIGAVTTLGANTRDCYTNVATAISGNAGPEGC